MTSIPGPIWTFASPSVPRATIRDLIRGMAARGESFEAFWTIGGDEDWVLARALEDAPLAGPVGTSERLARKGSADDEDGARHLTMARPGAAWRNEPWLRGPDRELYVHLTSTLDPEDAETFEMLEGDAKPRVVSFVASIVPVDALLQEHASVVYATLATLEECASGGVAWFNHEAFTRSADEARRAMFRTEGLTLDEVARHARAGRLGRGP